MTSGATVRHCGWGNTRFPGIKFPDELKCVNVEYITVDACNAGDKYGGAIREGWFCAGIDE